jgi:hypothetical protein
MLEREDEALPLILQGLFWNRHIADMLLGLEEPESIRYIGDPLPDRLRASEFFHEEGRRLRRNSRFMALLRLARNDGEIASELDRLGSQVQRREEDRQFRMEPHYWGLMTGSPPEGFLTGHVRRLKDSMMRPGTDHWLPRPGDLLRVEVVETKLVNWKLRLLEDEGVIFYMKRPGGEIERPAGDRFAIRVQKAWRHRKSVFVTAAIERE